MIINVSLYKDASMKLLPRIDDGTEKPLVVGMRLSAIISAPLLASYYWVCKYRNKNIDYNEIQYLLDFYGITDIREVED